MGFNKIVGTPSYKRTAVKKYKNSSRYKKYYKKKFNIKRNLKTNMQSIKLEYNDFIGLNNGSSDYKFIGILNQSRNITNMIQATRGWQNNSPLYSFYRVNGMSLHVGRVCSEGTNTVPGIGIPPLYIAFFPTNTGVVNGSTVVMAMDNNLRVDGYVSGVQSKYIAFPSDLHTGVGGSSTYIGVWCNVSDITNLNGQLECGTPNVTLATANQITFEIRVTFYVQFCDNHY